MRRILAGRIRAVVAADAISRDVHVVEVRRYPGDCRVAVIAVLAARNVRRVLAGGDRAVMAGAAGAEYLCVVDGVGRRPDDVVVAVRADVGGVDVRRVLARGLGAVVAADAIRGNVGVIEIRRYPGDRRVAVVAVGAAGDMRRVLAGGGRAVMAGAAGTDHLCVVDGRCGRPADGAVAVLADVAGIDVRRVLAGGRRAVVATDATSGDVGVIENRGHPERVRVAIIAAVARGHMARRFARCRYAVVAAGAASGHRHVIHDGHGAPRGRRMAGGAHFRRGHMVAWLHGRQYGANLRVAAGATASRSLEDPARMAAIATHVQVSAFEFETGAEVIERLLGTRQRGNRQYKYGNEVSQDSGSAASGACEHLSFCTHRILSTSSKELAEWQRPQSKPNSPLCTSSAL